MKLPLIIPAIAAAVGCLSIAMATTSKLHHDTVIYDFKMNDIDGKQVSLNKFKGKVLLVVNVASYCGNTPQYTALEALYTDKKEKGFAVLGFPANNFGAQEPDSNATIKEFCTSKYKVNFPMFAKISVKGEDEHPLYKWLIASSDHPDADIDWNFAKFVIGKDGKVAARFKARVKPDSPEVLAAIDAALAK
jgi:glutathione peroxidase